MIFDQQNMYMDNSLTSNVIANVGGGDAADPLFLVITAPTALATSGTITAALETSDSESFSTKTVVVYSCRQQKGHFGCSKAAVWHEGFFQTDCYRRKRRQTDCWLD